MKEAVTVASFFEQIQFSPFAKQLLLGIKEEDAFQDQTSMIEVVK
jgi:hypothetical protein